MVYLDSAATTLQKPSAVARAAARAIQALASPGRGGHPPAMEAAETAYQCRQEAAGLFGLADPERVIFTLNATHALNIAIKSLVRWGDTVVVSGYEHNAVTRPLTALDCNIRIAGGKLFSHEEILREFDRLIDDEVSCVIVNHVSNVFGYILPVDDIADLCRTRGKPLILDASQSAGTVPFRMEELGCAFAAMPGHKGLYGPQGTGLLLVGEGENGEPLLEGGTGSRSLQQEMPDFLPDRLEAGTHNMPGIAGLLEGIRFVRGKGEENILRHEQKLVKLAADKLKLIPGVGVFRAEKGERQAGVLSFVVEGKDCEEVGEYLGRRQIAVRAGLHCAPYAHRTAGTLETGTVRASFSAFNTPEDAVKLAAAVRGIAVGLRNGEK